MRLLIGMMSPPWREDWSVIYLYNCYRALPDLSHLDPSPAEVVTVTHCLIEDQLAYFLPPTTRRATVEVFHSASTQKCRYTSTYNISQQTAQKVLFLIVGFSCCRRNILICEVSVPHTTTGLVVSRYRRALLSPFLHDTV
jgi:hypothetical protein